MSKDEVKVLPEEQIGEMKAARDQAREMLKTSRKSKDDLPQVDEEGIRFTQHKKPAPPVLCGVDRTIFKYPLWANSVVQEADGTVRPKIVMIPVSENHSGGQLVEISKRKKGFREVSEIPDRYAKFRDPYLKAIAAWRKKERDAAELRQKLAEAGFAPRKKGGVTGIGSMAGLTGGK